MFFSISSEPKTNFVEQYRVDQLYINTDSGWQVLSSQNRVLIYKGYADQAPLEKIINDIAEQPEPRFTGNFCVLVYQRSTQTIKIKTDLWRSFPIYLHPGHEVTNLTASEQVAWCDTIVEVAAGINITETKFDPIGDIPTESLTEQQGLERIEQILTAKTRAFLQHNQLPVRTFLTGGVDSLLVHSYTNRSELVPGFHFEWDYFYLKNTAAIKKFWGYSQIHHWREPCVLASGTPGDEFMLRSPTTANMYMLHSGTSIPEANTDPANLHFSYYGKYQSMFDAMQPMDYACMSYRELVRHICNIILNDWQHWHLGRTITWTPLRDLDITKTILSMPPESIKGQILNSEISRQLIEQKQPGLSRVISSQKNTGNVYENLIDYYASKDLIKLSSGVVDLTASSL